MRANGGLNLKSDVFGAKIHLNETARFGKNDAVSCTVFNNNKKKPKTVPFWNGTIVFFPAHAENRGEEDFFFSTFRLLSFQFFAQKDAHHGHPLAWRCYPLKVVEGAVKSSRPNTFSLPCFPINTGEGCWKKEREEKTKRGGREEKGEQREGKRERRENTEEEEEEGAVEERTKKHRGEREGKRRATPATPLSAPLPDRKSVV